MIGNRISGEEFAGLVDALWPAFGQPRHHTRLPGIDAVTAHETVEIVEATHGRQFTVTDVPLSGSGCAVADRLEHLCDGQATGIERTPITRKRFTLIPCTGKFSGLIGSHQPNTRLVRVKPGEQ